MIDYFSINAEVWKFFKKYLNIALNDKDDSFNWKIMFDEAFEIEKKYNCEYCHDLIMAQVNELDRVYHKTINR